jgi:hypothetical protein
MVTIANSLKKADVDFTTMTYDQLVAYGKSNHASVSGFSTYKKALFAVFGIDFDAMKAEKREAKREAEQADRPRPTHEVTMYSDAHAKSGRFAITTEQGVGLWYGRLFDVEHEQNACELEAARKAVYLAGEIRKARGIAEGGLMLILRVDAQWLLAFDNGNNNKASCLLLDEKKAGIILSIEHVKSADNLADNLSKGTTYCKAKDNLALADIYPL